MNVNKRDMDSFYIREQIAEPLTSQSLSGCDVLPNYGGLVLRK